MVLYNYAKQNTLGVKKQGQIVSTSITNECMQLKHVISGRETKTSVDVTKNGWVVFRKTSNKNIDKFNDKIYNIAKFWCALRTIIAKIISLSLSHTLAYHTKSQADDFCNNCFSVLVFCNF